ncbi:hypothetical protein C8J56DRAFT_799379 [Mycena floridula]|nr:hypothetical protein C8J56DRAFT_799379 [Mycena floridula]
MWKQLVRGWVALESSYNFENGRGGLSASGRPDQVHWWVSCKRKSVVLSTLVDLEPFVEIFSSWWSALNPEWREHDITGKLVQSSGGSWDCLRAPGINGMLSVIACMWWWALKAEKGVKDSAWIQMAEDIIWVCEQLGIRSGKQHSADDSQANRAGKRIRSSL